MIPKIAYFFWGDGTPFSFLRLLTLRSFRKFHPGWKMVLYKSEKQEGFRTWSTRDRQDFMSKDDVSDFSSEWDGLGIEIRSYSNGKRVAPNFVSDFFRWDVLRGGGWYLDVDQIVCRPFDDLGGYDFVYGCRSMPYVGVLGASKESLLPEIAFSEIDTHFDANDYCCIGPQFFIYLNERCSKFVDQKSKEKVYRTENEAFYPISSSDDVVRIHSGEFQIPDTSYAVHWFGGHPESQKFNRGYTPEFAASSNDTISRFAKDNDLLVGSFTL